MRLPWIQVDKEGIARCHRLARHLGVPEAQGVGIGIMLWEYALEIAPDGDFSGTIPDTESLAAAVMWPIPDAPRLVVELQRAGLIATTPTLRCCGLDRYRAAWEKNQRRNGNPVNSGSGVPATGENRPVSPGNREKPRGTARKTETETDTKKKQKPPVAEAPAAQKPKVEKSTDPRHAPLVKVLVDGFEALRGIPYPFKPRDAAAVRDLLAAAEPDTIAQAWGRALKHTGFPTVSTLPELHERFAHFVGTGPPVAKQREFDPNQGIIRSGTTPGDPCAARDQDPFPWSTQ